MDITATQVRLRDIEVNYYRAGSADRTGNPVVFVHGMAETADSCWSQQLSTISDQFDCYAMDLRGHGRTTLGDSDATLDQFGEDLLEFLREVTGPATVVGFSLGGTIALWAASRQTGLVDHVISVGGSSVISAGTADIFRKKAAWIADKDLLALHNDMRDEATAMLHKRPELGEHYAARRIASVGEGLGYSNAGLAMARMRDHKLQPLLADVDVPVDVVGGEFDPWCPKRAAEIIIDGLPDGTPYTEIPAVGHLMSIDDPDAVSATVTGLLSRARSVNA